MNKELHKLTSDAEGEEMLTVPRKTVQEMFAEAQKTIPTCEHDNVDSSRGNVDSLEPKYHKGDKVLYKGKLKVVMSEMFPNRYYSIALPNGQSPFCRHESDLEPYTEPEEESRNLSQETANCDKEFDNILKDSFSKERRLNVATQIISGILSNQKMLNNLTSGETTVEGVVKRIVDATMLYTDALLAKAEKGGCDV